MSLRSYSVEQLLDELLKMRDETVRAALLAPTGRDAFDYGRLSGKYLCFEEVINYINDRLEEVERESEEDEVSEFRADSSI
jgi:hypothetical protein